MQAVSIHVVDVANGVVAQGMQVDIFRAGTDHDANAPTGTSGAAVTAAEPRWSLFLTAPVGANGVVDGIEAHPQPFTPGLYEARLHVADYYRARGTDLPRPAFMEVQVFRFGLADVSQHCHLPVKLTAWGLSCFRGAA
jgi:5-hydroxyisourate hydrolase